MSSYQHQQLVLVVIVSGLFLNSAFGAAVYTSIALCAVICASLVIDCLLVHRVKSWINGADISTSSASGTVVIYLPDHCESLL
jgi:uncharacterized membrane protein YdcZ (DUF606 family)